MSDDPLELILQMGDASRREELSRSLASLAGAEALIVFIRDPEVSALIPAPGFRRTLPGGAGWARLRSDCARAGVHRGRVAWPDSSSQLDAHAVSVDEGLAFVFVGTLAEFPPGLRRFMPLLARMFQAELAVSSAQAKATVAEDATRHASTLMAAVESARTDAEEARREAHEASAAKDEFLAMLGHELRNPLSPILTALQILKMKGQGESREIAVIGRQVKHLIGLVDDLLDVSRITRGKVTLHPEVIEIADPVDKALEMARPLFEEKFHTLAVDVPATGLRIHGDRLRVAQIVANLLTNAARYTDRGGTIRMRAALESGEVVVRVTDNGLGIAPEMQARIFEPFVQAHRSPARANGGLGLGLALVKNLTQLHGGTIAVHSDGPGKGSEFSVRFPVAHAEVQQLQSVVPAVAGVAPMSIGVVDDNVDAAELLAQMLRAGGHRVFIAHDGPAALQLFEAESLDAAIVDIGLPVMDGYEVAKRVREKHGPRIRLVALTGYGQPNDVQRSRQNGFDAHLVKPVDSESVLRALARPA